MDGVQGRGVYSKTNLRSMSSPVPSMILIPASAHSRLFGFLPTGSLFAVALTRNVRGRSMSGWVVWTTREECGGRGICGICISMGYAKTKK